MPCDHCEHLREEVETLRRELGIAVRVDVRNRLRVALGLDAAEAAIVGALHQVNGRVLSPDRLAMALPTDNDDRDADGISKTYICRIRQKLGREAIRTVWGEGYAMTAVGHAKVAGVLS